MVGKNPKSTRAVAVMTMTGAVVANHTAVVERKGVKMAETIRGWFRRIYGYDEQHRCKDCANLRPYKANRKWYKCKKMGESRSSATDIKLKDFACALYEPMEGSEECEKR